MIRDLEPIDDNEREKKEKEREHDEDDDGFSILDESCACRGGVLTPLGYVSDLNEREMPKACNETFEFSPHLLSVNFGEKSKGQYLLFYYFLFNCLCTN